MRKPLLGLASWLVAVSLAHGQGIVQSQPIQTHPFTRTLPMQTWRCSSAQVGVTNQLEFLSPAGSVISSVDCSGIIHGAGAPPDTVINVAALTPYTPGMDLWAATQTAIAACGTGPCTYDYRGYAGLQIETFRQLLWPAGSAAQFPAMTITEPNGVSVVSTYTTTIYGPTVSNDDTKGLVIKKLNLTTDQTSEIYVYGGFNSVHNLATGATTPSGPQMPLTSVANSTNTTSLTSGYYLSGGNITGMVGQTCHVSTFNGGGASATATFTLVQPNSLAMGQYFTVTAIGAGYGSAPTTAVLSDGTANCNGAISIFSLLGETTYTGTTTACAANACAGKTVGILGFGDNGDGFYQIFSSTNLTITVSASGITALTPAPTQNLNITPFAFIAGGFGISNFPEQPFTQSSIDALTLGSDLGMGMFNSGCNCDNVIGTLTTAATHGAIFVGATTNANMWNGMYYLTVSDETMGYANAYGWGWWLLDANGNNISGYSDLEDIKHSMILESSSGNLFPGIYYSNPPAELAGWPGQLSFPILSGNSSYNTIGCAAGAIMGVNLADPGYPNTICSFGKQATSVPNGINYGSLLKATLPQTISNQPHSVCPSGPCGTSYANTYRVVLRDFNSLAAGNCSVGCSTYIGLTPDGDNNASLDATHYIAIPAPGNDTPGLACFDVLKDISATWKSLALCVNPSTTFNDDGSYDAGAGAYTFPIRDFTADATTTGLLAGATVGQSAANSWAGTCTMSTGTSCTQSTSVVFAATPLCYATDQANPIAGTCTLSAGTVTVTAGSSNSDAWAWQLVGNPN